MSVTLGWRWLLRDIGFKSVTSCIHTRINANIAHTYTKCRVTFRDDGSLSLVWTNQNLYEAIRSRTLKRNVFCFQDFYFQPILNLHRCYVCIYLSYVKLSLLLALLTPSWILKSTTLPCISYPGSELGSNMPMYSPKALPRWCVTCLGKRALQPEYNIDTLRSTVASNNDLSPLKLMTYTA